MHLGVNPTPAMSQRPLTPPLGADVRDLPLVSVGDAFDFLPRLAPTSVATVVTSPPYWGLRSYGHDHNPEILAEWAEELKNVKVSDQTPPPYSWYRANGGILGLEPYPSWYISHLAEILNLFQTTLEPTGSMWINLGDTYFARWSSIRSDGRQGLGTSTRDRRKTPSGGYLHDKQLLMLPARFAIAMQELGWILRNDLVWAKPVVAPRPERDRLRSSHEHFFHFVKRSKVGRPSYYYDMSKVEPDHKDVVVVPAARGRDSHSATFPAELIRPRIASSCPPGGLVVDPFCGTGRTLQVAIEEGRAAYGIELSAQYAASARRNVRQTRASLQLAAPERTAKDV